MIFAVWMSLRLTFSCVFPTYPSYTFFSTFYLSFSCLCLFPHFLHLLFLSHYFKYYLYSSHLISLLPTPFSVLLLPRPSFVLLSSILFVVTSLTTSPSHLTNTSPPHHITPHRHITPHLLPSTSLLPFTSHNVTDWQWDGVLSNTHPAWLIPLIRTQRKTSCDQESNAHRGYHYYYY